MTPTTFRSLSDQSISSGRRLRRGLGPVGALLVPVLLLSACTSGTEAVPPESVATGPVTAEAVTAEATAAAAAVDLAPLITRIEGSLERNGVPGAVVLVRSPWTGTWSHAFGSRAVGSPEPVTTDDVFGLADLTATMTAAVLLKLQDEGKLSLADPISQYVEGVPGGDELTLEALGEYRSGLFSYDQDPGFRAAVAADPTRVWSPQELLDIAFAHPAVPTDTFNYSHTDYVLLGLVIEKVTGTSAAEAFRTLLFEPLGLDDIGLPADATLPEPHATGHVFPVVGDTVVLEEDQRAAAAAGTLLPQSLPSAHPSSAWTAGGAYGTASDVATLFEAVVDGPLVTADTRAEWNDELRGGLDTPGGVRYGFGMAVHGDYHLYGGLVDGWSTLAAHAPDLDTTVVVLTNLARTPTGGSPVAEIQAAVLEQLDTLAVEPPLALPTTSVPAASTAPTS